MEMREFLSNKKIPLDLQLQVREHMSTSFRHRRAFDEREALSKLPPTLMFGMLHKMYDSSVFKVPVFMHLDETILAELCFLLVPCSFGRGASVFDVGDVAREVYIVMKGRVTTEMLADDGATLLSGPTYTAAAMAEEEPAGIADDAAAEEPPEGPSQQCSFFGEEVLDFLDGVPLYRHSKATAATECDLSLLRARDVEHLAKQHPSLQEHILKYQRMHRRRIANQRLQRRTRMLIAVNKGLVRRRSDSVGNAADFLVKHRAPQATPTVPRRAAASSEPELAETPSLPEPLAHADNAAGAVAVVAEPDERSLEESSARADWGEQPLMGRLLQRLDALTDAQLALADAVARIEDKLRTEPRPKLLPSRQTPASPLSQELVVDDPVFADEPDATLARP